MTTQKMNQFKRSPPTLAEILAIDDQILHLFCNACKESISEAERRNLNLCEDHQSAWLLKSVLVCGD